MWPLILEKALAKMYGNYDRISKGLGSEGLNFLTGKPVVRMPTGKKNRAKLLAA